MIPLQEQQSLRRFFAEAVKQRVKLDFFTQKRLMMVVPGREECQLCDDVQTLLGEIAHLNSLFTLAVHELGAEREPARRHGVDKVPATVIRGVLNRPVTYYGAPFGLLFTPFVESLVMMSVNQAVLPSAVSKKLKRLRDPVSVRVFVTPDAEFGPPMVTAAVAFAIESRFVRAELIEVSEFPRLAERYGVKQVPFTVINDRTAFPGVVDPESFADQVVKGASSRTLTAELPRSQGATPLGSAEAARPRESVRPSGLIVPGR